MKNLLKVFQENKKMITEHLLKFIALDNNEEYVETFTTVLNNFELTYDEKNNGFIFYAENMHELSETKTMYGYILSSIKNIIKFEDFKGPNNTLTGLLFHSIYTYNPIDYNKSTNNKVVPIFNLTKREEKKYKSDIISDKDKFVIKCPECGETSDAELKCLIYIDKDDDDYVIRCNIIGVVCKDCKTVSIDYDFKLYGNQNTYYPNPSKNVTNIFENNNNIVLSKIYTNHIMENNKIYTFVYNDRITFNPNTGFTYVFPTINKTTGKKINSRQPNIARISLAEFDFKHDVYIKKEDFYKIGKAIEKNNNPNNITFEEYLQQIRDFMAKNKESIYSKDIETYIEHNRMKILLNYNANKNVTYFQLNSIYSSYKLCNSYNGKIKIFANNDIVKDLENLFMKEMNKYNVNPFAKKQITKKYAKKYNFYDFSRSLKLVEQLTAIVEDINYINTIIKNAEGHMLFETLCTMKRVLTSNFAKDYTEKYSQKTLINRTSKVKEYWKVESLINEYSMYKRLNDLTKIDIKIPKKFNVDKLYYDLRKETSRLSKASYIFEYSDNILALEDTIDDYRFEIIKSSDDLICFGRTMGNCVGSYHDTIISKQNIIFCISSLKDDNKICMQLATRETHGIMQCKNKYNSSLKEEQRKVIKKWAHKHNIEDRTSDDLYKKIKKNTNKEIAYDLKLTIVKEAPKNSKAYSFEEVNDARIVVPF